MPKEIPVTLATIEHHEEVKSLEKHSQKSVDWAEAIKVKTDEEQTTAITGLTKIVNERKAGDKLRRFFTDPLNEQVKRINALFMPKLALLEKAEGIIRSKLGAYQLSLAEKSVAKKEKVMEQIEAGEIGIEAGTKKLDKVKEPEKTVRQEEATVTFRVGYEVIVENEASVPREYLIPDMKRIQTVALALHKAKQPQIAGIKVVEKKVPNVRTNF